VSSKQTRRRFLKVSALGIAAASTSQFSTAMALPASGDISVRVTAGTQRYAAAPSLSWQTGEVSGPNVVALDPTQKYQDILGFGAAFSDAACYTFNRLEPSVRASLFHELFHPSEIGLNVCRTCIGSSDYSTEVFSYDEGEPDPEMKRFSIAHDRAYVLPMLREARKENPDLFLFSSPWSPPGWMKAGGSMLGGSMRSRYYAAYAQYFLKFLQAYTGEGVPVQAVSVQNEVDTDQDSRMPACLWPQEYEIAFVKDHLGPLFEKNKISTKIWILDHNYNLWGRAIGELEDPGLRKFCSGIAFHGYVGTADMMSRVHNEFPDAQLYWTEGGPDYTAPDYATDWTSWGKTFTEALRNWCRAITGWNLALDEKGRPNIGPFSCGGMVTIHSRTREISRSGQYWAFAHFARNIQRGARRFESTANLPGVEHVAFENPDGRKILILTNSGDDTTITLKLADQTTNVSLAKNSLQSLIWT
jgi:glucosylceramidase